MPCVENRSVSTRLWPLGRVAVLGSLVLLASCSLLQRGEAPPGPEGQAGSGAEAGKGSKGVAGRAIRLPPPAAPGSMAEARLQAARRLVAANPDGTYMGKPPDILLAIPVMTIELNADGSVRKINVMRYPSQARDTVELAKVAIYRAAPFGNVSRLPKPWTFNETFLFNDERKFKPMTLDQR